MSASPTCGSARSGTDSRLDRATSGCDAAAAVTGTVPVVAHTGLLAAHSSVGSTARRRQSVSDSASVAAGTCSVGSVTPRSDAPQPLQNR